MRTRRDVLDAPLRHAVAWYLRCAVADVALLSVQVIRARPRARRQLSHRDHEEGPARVVCLVVSCDDTPVQTLIAPGTHMDLSLRGSVFDSALEPAAQDTSTAALYDPFVVHAGAATGAVPPLRLFFTFVRATEDAAAVDRLKQCFGGCTSGMPARLDALL